MTLWEILGAVGFLLWFFALLAAIVLAATVGLNRIAYRVEAWLDDRHGDVADRCNVYQLHPRPVSEIRPRGDAA